MQKYWQENCDIFSMLNKQYTKKEKGIYFIFITLLSFLSCKTIEISPVENYRSQLGVNFNNHNTVYTFSSDSIFKTSATQQLDNFDYTFYENLRNNLNSRNYIVGNQGPLQTINLEQCIISIESLNALNKSNFNKETINYRAMIACKTLENKEQIFYAYSEIKTDSFKLNEIEMNKLAINLAYSASNKIDSLQKEMLVKKDPVKFGSNIEKREISILGQTILIVLAAFILIYL